MRGIFARFGFANVLSLMSLAISVTCFAFMARMSQQYAKVHLNKIEPKVIMANNEAIKVAIDKNKYEMDSNVYDNIVQDINKIYEPKEETEAVKPKKVPIPVNSIQAEPAKEENEPKEEVISKDNLKETIKKNSNTSTYVQLGVFKSHREAVASWFKMIQEYKALEGLRYHIITTTNPDNTYFYLLQIKDKKNQEAEKLLALLQEQGLKASLIETQNTKNI